MPRRNDIKKVLIIGVQADAIERGEDRLVVIEINPRTSRSLYHHHRGRAGKRGRH